MKCKNKIIAVFFAVCMLFSIGIPCMSAEETTVVLSDIDENSHTGKAVMELVRLGIINGYEDGTFRPDRTITRGEFAKIIITFLGFEDITFDTIDSGFPDVDGENGANAHWAKKYIKLAADKKIVNGYDDGTFRPDDNVKYVEAVKMLVCALGYGQIAIDKTIPGATWYASYMLQATEIGITEKASINHVEDPASRGIVAVLTSNSLDIDIATVNASGETVIHYGETVLSAFHRKGKIAGTVTAIAQTGLQSCSTGLRYNQIRVLTEMGSKVYLVPAEYDKEALLGRRISGFVEKNDDGEEMINQIAVENTKVTKITSDMLPEIKNGSISYFDSKDAKTASTLYVESDITFIYNGKYDAAYSIRDIEALTSGEVLFVCNDMDNRAEVALVTEYETFVVSSVDKSGEIPKVYAKYNAGNIEIPYEDEDCKFSLTKDGAEGDAKTIVNGLKEWDVLSVARSREGADGISVWKGKVSTKKLDGQKVNGKNGNVRTLGTEDFMLSGQYMQYLEDELPQAPRIEVGDVVTVYLDHEGKIAAAATNIADAAVYAAYLVDAYYKNKEPYVQLYGITGITKERTLKLARTVRIDGVPERNYEMIFGKLRTASTVVNEDKDTELFNAKAYNQLIYYSTNEAGEVNMIDTVTTNTTTSDEDLMRSVAYPSDYAELTYSGGKLLDGTNQVMTVNRAKVLVIPRNPYEIDKYAIKSSSFFVENSPYKVEAYNVNTVKEAKYVLVYGNVEGVATISADSPMMLVKTLVETMDEETNQTLDQAVGYDFRTASYKVLLTEQAGIFSSHYSTGDIFRYAMTGDRVDATKLLLRCGTTRPIIYNNNDEAVSEPITEAADEAAAVEIAKRRFFQFDDQTLSNTHGRVVYGTVLGREGNTIMITPTIKEDVYGIQDAGYETFGVSGAKVYLYDYTKSGEERISVGASLDAIMSYNQLLRDGADTNRATQIMMFHTGTSNVKAIILFKLQ